MVAGGCNSGSYAWGNLDIQGLKATAAILVRNGFYVAALYGMRGYRIAGLCHSSVFLIGKFVRNAMNAFSIADWSLW